MSAVVVSAWRKGPPGPYSEKNPPVWFPRTSRNVTPPPPGTRAPPIQKMDSYIENLKMDKNVRYAQQQSSPASYFK